MRSSDSHDSFADPRHCSSLLRRILAAQVNMTATAALTSLRCHIKSLKVSSVLQGNTADYGKSHLISSDSSTCWQSESSSNSSGETKPQTIGIEFTHPMHIQHIVLQFQGGFTPRLMHVTVAKQSPTEAGAVKPAYEPLLSVEPLDSNEVQRWHCEAECVIGLRFKLENSSDFFGRIICYSLDVQGVEQPLRSN